MTGSWYPLAWTDPVPGDPTAVRAAARQYEDVAARVTRASADLRAVAEGMPDRSQAVDEVRSRAAEAAERVTAAHDRYAATGAALADYADGLDRAQQVAQDALTAARRAAEAIEHADQDVRRWAQQAADAVDVAQSAAYDRLAETARGTRDDAEHALTRARELLDGAVVARDVAAQAARDLIERVIAEDGLADSLWGGLVDAASAVGSWFGDVGHWFFDHIDEIATVLGVAALLLAWVPVLGQALAAAALIAGALQLARDVYLALTTDAGWGAVAVGALGLVTFGVGRLAGQGLRLAANSARAQQGVRMLPVSGQAASAGARGGAAAQGAQASLRRGFVTLPAGTQTWTSSALWSVMRPGAIARDLVSDVTGVVRYMKDPGLAASSGALGHVSRPVDVLTNAFSEGAHALRNTPAGIERVTALLGDAGAARDMRFLTGIGGDLGQSGAALRGWAAGRGVLQIVDVGIVVDSVTPRG
ncbi:hypothetical protein [Cellulomonas sp. S1-8]|uniref:hypothetical protein n=1 Tax=Cellulomonas sp. S1-8 TaxID=2904790 RepID=UPI0022435B07|nr:hypothetical protein [Cellulomonas sp. S1-8]UZN02688.1 hypothetical protein OKX07_16770 [Cellulomonas sp. S1-8]